MKQIYTFTSKLQAETFMFKFVSVFKSYETRIVLAKVLGFYY